jgi:hypothetical protein
MKVHPGVAEAHPGVKISHPGVLRLVLLSKGLPRTQRTQLVFIMAHNGILLAHRVVVETSLGIIELTPAS